MRPFVVIIMPFHRNFTYWIDKRKWKYVFLLTTLELSRSEKHHSIAAVQECDPPAGERSATEDRSGIH